MTQVKENEMVERVARSVDQALKQGWKGNRPPTSEFIACAAIAAMREPSEGMLVSGVVATAGAPLSDMDAEFLQEAKLIRRAGWEAMIDAALNGK